MSAALNPAPGAEPVPFDPAAFALALSNRVEAARGRGIDYGDAERLRRELESLHSALVRPSPGQPLAARVAAAVAPSHVNTSPDPVVALVLAFLADCEESIDHYCERGVLTYARKLKCYDAAFGDLAPAEIRLHAVEVACSIGYDEGTHATLADDHPEFLRRRAGRADPGLLLPTGLGGLDARLGGGLSGLTLLAGPTNVGKTSLAAAAVRNALTANPAAAALVVQLDMVKQQMVELLYLAGGAAADGGASAPPDYFARARVLESRNAPRSGEYPDWLGDTAGWLADARRELQERTGPTPCSR